MSKASFIWKPYKVWFVRYSYIFNEYVEHERVAFGSNEEEALLETRASLYPWSNLETFEAEVIGFKQY